MRLRLGSLLLATLLAAPVTGCATDPSAGPGETVVQVFAASSLRAPFEELGERFHEDHPDVTLAFSFAGSSDLAAQIKDGADADVFASADARNMAVVGADAIDPVDFATNTLAIAVPSDNPAHIDALEDLANDGVRLVTCAPQVPCGAAAASVEASAGLDWEPVSEEQAVVDVLGKVRSGEADAGLVYVTDLRVAGDAVRGIRIPASVNALTTYPIALLAGAETRKDAAAFVRFVLGAEGQQVLADAGFGKARP